MMFRKGLYQHLLCTVAIATTAFAPSRHTKRQYFILESTDEAFAVPEATSVQDAKTTLLQHLQAGEDDNSPALTPYLDILKESYIYSGTDARFSLQPFYNGDWENVNTPTFPGRLGLTPDKKKLSIYTIGRLTFGLIPSAKNVEVAVRKMVQHVHFASAIPREIPTVLRDTVHSNPTGLRTNHIDTVFEIPDSSIKGILRMEGYTIPNLEENNRYDTWFVGGSCLAQSGGDTNEWNRVFGQDSLEYSLAKPVTAHQKVVFLDDDLRIGIGNLGSVMIVRRE